MKVYNLKIGILCTFFIVFIVQLGYISYTPYYSRQHDARSFTNYENGGHFGYIGYIFYNNKLPSVSPAKYWCFYNPPLFYIISAIFIKVQDFLKIGIDEALNNLQITTLIYIAIFNIYVYKIMKEMNIKKALPYMISFIRINTNYGYFVRKLRKWSFVCSLINNVDLLYNEMD